MLYKSARFCEDDRTLSPLISGGNIEEGYDRKRQSAKEVRLGAEFAMNTIADVEPLLPLLRQQRLLLVDPVADVEPLLPLLRDRDVSRLGEQRLLKRIHVDRDCGDHCRGHLLDEGISARKEKQYGEETRQGHGGTWRRGGRTASMRERLDAKIRRPDY